VGRGGAVAPDEFRARAEEARATIAAVLVASTDRVTLAPNVGSAITSAAASLDGPAARRIVLVGDVEPATRRALVDLARLAGAPFVGVAAEVREGPQTLADRVRIALDSGPGLVCAAHVSPRDGRILPIVELAAIAHDAHARLVVDGTLAVGAVPVDIGALGADVYAAAGDRWLCGPTGVAAVYTRPDAAPRDAGNSVASDAGGLSRAAVVGFARSAGWLAMQVGLDWAYERIAALTDAAVRELSAIPGVAVRRAEPRGAIVALQVDRWPAPLLRDELGHRVFAVVGLTPDGDALRVSLGWWNTGEEVATLAEAIRAIAALDPGDVVRRAPILVVPGDPT
jgi:selenocysteine lyase/cysteine desulfurase